MMNVSFNCKTCNSSFYVNNIINIGRPSNKEVACPICQSKILVLTSGIPTSSKIQTRRCLISDFLTKNYSHLPLFKNCIYHITSEKNIKLIQQNGLSPYNILKGLNISVTTGGDSSSLFLDNSLRLDKYIHLSFTPWCPMFANKNDLYSLSISLDILDQPDIIFCNKIATSKDAVFYDYIDTNAFDLEAVYDCYDWKTTEGQSRRNQAEKYEILVPSNIPPDKILEYKKL